MSKQDLIKQCMKDMGMKPNEARDLQAGWCNFCLNSSCHRAALSDDIWFERISTQVEKLLENPNIAPFNDPKFKEIVEQKFEDRRMNAMKIELISNRGDWTVPTQDEVMAYRQSKERPSSFQSEPENVEALLQEKLAEPEEVEPVGDVVVKEEVVIPEPFKPPVKAEDSKQPAFVPPVRREPAENMEANTPTPTSGIMIGGSPSAPKQTNQGAQDPWSVSTKKEEFVDLGAKITLGKKK